MPWNRPVVAASRAVPGDRAIWGKIDCFLIQNAISRSLPASKGYSSLTSVGSLVRLTKCRRHMCSRSTRFIWCLRSVSSNHWYRLSEEQLKRILAADVAYFNHARRIRASPSSTSWNSKHPPDKARYASETCSAALSMHAIGTWHSALGCTEVSASTFNLRMCHCRNWSYI